MPLSHERRGSGEPLLLLHGIGHCWQGWWPVLDPLVAAGFEVMAVDLPGFGASAPLAPGVHPDVMAHTAAVAAFLDELGWERPHVAGNSMGGAVAIELGRMGRARSVTALSPAGFWTPRERVWCQASLGPVWGLVHRSPGPFERLAGAAAGRRMLFGQLMARPARLPAEHARTTLRALGGAEVFPATLAAFDDYVVRDSPELHELPVTVAWGRRDWLLVPRSGRRVTRVLPTAELRWLDGCGHVPMWDDPVLVSRNLVDGARRATAG